MSYDAIAIAKKQALNDLRNETTREFARLREETWARRYDRFNAEWDARIQAGNLPVPDALPENWRDQVERDPKQVGPGE